MLVFAAERRRNVATGGAQRNPWKSFIASRRDAGILRPCRGGKWGFSKPRVALRFTRGYIPLPLRGQEPAAPTRTFQQSIVVRHFPEPNFRLRKYLCRKS